MHERAKRPRINRPVTKPDRESHPRNPKAGWRIGSGLILCEKLRELTKNAFKNASHRQTRNHGDLRERTVLLKGLIFRMGYYSTRLDLEKGRLCQDLWWYLNCVRYHHHHFQNLVLGRMVVEVPVGEGGVKVTPPESRHIALPAASRAQVVPTRQQKFSPGHSTGARSAHPRLGEVQQRSRITFTRPTHQRW